MVDAARFIRFTGAHGTMGSFLDTYLYRPWRSARVSVLSGVQNPRATWGRIRESLIIGIEYVVRSVLIGLLAVMGVMCYGYSLNFFILGVSIGIYLPEWTQQMNQRVAAAWNGVLTQRFKSVIPIAGVIFAAANAHFMTMAILAFGLGGKLGVWFSRNSVPTDPCPIDTSQVSCQGMYQLFPSAHASLRLPRRAADDIEICRLSRGAYDGYPYFAYRSISS